MTRHFHFTPLPPPTTTAMSGGGSADPPPPQRPNGGEFLLSLLCNPTNAHHHRPPHHHGDHSPHNPSSAQHHPFPSQPVPLNPAVAAVGPAIVPSNVHDRASAPWPPQAVSPPSQRPPPHLFYPHHFTAHPPSPDPNQQFAHPVGDFRRGDSGRTGFIDRRLPHQFQQRDLSAGSLGFGPVDGISSESLGFQGNKERQVMLSGAHHREHVNSHQESRKSNLQGSSSMNKGFSTPLGYLHRNEVDSRERENQIYGNVHRMMSTVAVDRVIGGRGERESGGQRMGYGFEGTGEKRGTRPRNSYRERNDEDSMYRNGSGDVHLFQRLDRPGLPSGSVVHSVSPAQAEFLGEVGDDASGKNNGGQYEKAEGLDDLEARFDGIAVGKDEVDPINEKNQSQHMRDKDFRSDPRGQQILSQKARAYKRFMQCRWDIDRLIIPLFAIYESLIPTEEEKVKQKQLLTLLEKLVNKEWPEAHLYLYGSCGNSFGVRNSDIDVCLEIQSGDIDKSELLLKLADILQADNLQDVKALTRARVPIVKLMDPVTGISCDICVNNMLAVVNTKLLRDYAQIDVRLRQLAYVVKHWAKSRAVNETYLGTLSSYAYVLMCIHFLQQRRPPILPCLQELDPTYTVMVDDIRCAYFDQVEKLTNFGSRNKESIAQLAWAFFNYWAYGHDYTNTVISVRTGHLLSKQSKDWTRRIGNDRHLICIEDPFDTSHDLGRVVDKFSIRVLKEEFERAAHIMQHAPNPCVSLFEPYISPHSSPSE